MREAWQARKRARRGRTWLKVHKSCSGMHFEGGCKDVIMALLTRKAIDLCLATASVPCPDYSRTRLAMRACMLGTPLSSASPFRSKSLLVFSARYFLQIYIGREEKIIDTKGPQIRVLLEETFFNFHLFLKKMVQARKVMLECVTSILRVHNVSSMCCTQMH